jgi:hypothetical protein
MTIDEFRGVMSDRTDADLVKMTTIERNQFQPDAVIAAEEELKKRNLTADQIETVNTDIRIETEKEGEKANEPLGIFWKILTFLFPGLINIFFSGAYTVDGFHRKARELRRWTVYGFGFYVGLILIIFLIDSFSWCNMGGAQQSVYASLGFVVVMKSRFHSLVSLRWTPWTGRACRPAAITSAPGPKRHKHQHWQ